MKRLPIINGKTKCSTCRKLKCVKEDFGVNNTRWSGIQSECKECRAKRRKKTYADKASTPEGFRELAANRLEWQRKNKDKVQAHCRDFYKRHRKSNIERTKRWRLKNRERYNERQRIARKSKPEQYKGYGRTNYERHKSYYKLNARLRKSRVRGAEGKCSLVEWKAIIEAQKGRCNGCGIDSEPLTLDHIIPISRGGSNWPSNIQGLCFTCNMRKSKMTMEEFMMRQNGRTKVVSAKR